MSWEWESWRKERDRVAGQAWTIEPAGHWGGTLLLSGAVTKFTLTSGQESFNTFFTGVGVGVPFDIDTSEKANPPGKTILHVFSPLDIRGVKGLFTGGKTGMLFDLGSAKIPVVHFISYMEPITGTTLTVGELASWGITALLGFKTPHTSTVIGAAAYIPTGEIKSSVKGQYGFWTVW